MLYYIVNTIYVSVANPFHFFDVKNETFTFESDTCSKSLYHNRNYKFSRRFQLCYTQKYLVESWNSFFSFLNFS